MTVVAADVLKPYFGKPSDISKALDSSTAEQVVVFQLPKSLYVDDSDLRITKLDSGEFELVVVLGQGHSKRMTRVRRIKKLQAGIHILDLSSEIDDPVEPAIFLREAAMKKRSQKAVLESGDWLNAKEVCTVAGLSDNNPSAQPHKWKKNAKIFSIRQGATEYYPSYGLDSEHGYRPLKALADVLQVFGAEKSGWSLAHWFNSVNSYLGGKRPKDLLAKEPQKVLSAAQYEVAGIQHG